MDPETTTSKDDTNSPSTNENHDVPIPPTIPLESLQSAEQRELMGLVGRLRRAGLSTLLQLPQIAVTGDQSSGKSSVLEALSGIPFPRKENLCTRFATEIIMRPDANMSISSKINPHPDTSEELQTKLKAFSKSIKSVEELPFLFEEATAVMGLDSHKAFSKDVLSIEICGPDVPHLCVYYLSH